MECVSEAECASQDAQTCIHGCQLKCPAWDLAPSPQCVNECLKRDSPCRKFVSCRPPVTGGYICHDGRWPESSSGCCESNLSRIGSCPRLCESQRTWRLDRKRQKGSPWWARWHQGDGMVAQCTCHGCPESMESMASTLQWTVKEDLWENGQRMLLDIARREGLLWGPTRRMQELMLQRNEEILRALEESKVASYRFDLDETIHQINRRYSDGIIHAARYFDDSERPVAAEASSNTSVSLMTFTIVCTTIVCTTMLGWVFYWKMYAKRTHRQNTDIRTFHGDQVVLGQPVDGEDMACVLPKATA